MNARICIFILTFLCFTACNKHSIVEKTKHNENVSHSKKQKHNNHNVNDGVRTSVSSIEWPVDTPGYDDSNNLRSYFANYTGNVDEALNWLLHRQDSADGQAGFAGLGRSVGLLFPNQIGLLADKISNIIAKQKFLSQAILAWGEKAPQQAADWALSNSSHFLSVDMARTDAVSILISAGDFSRAANVIDGMTDKPAIGAPLSELVESWGVKHPVEFTKRLNESNNEYVIEQGVYQLALQWAKMDRNSAAEWAEAQSDPSLHDYAYEGMASALVQTDPKSAWRYALAVYDNARQANLVDRLLSSNIGQRTHVRGWITEISGGNAVPESLEKILTSHGL